MKERNIEIAKMLGWVYIPESDESGFVHNNKSIGRNKVIEGNVVDTCCELFVKNPQERENSIKTFGKKVFDVSEFEYKLDFDKDWNLLMEAIEFIENQNRDTIVEIKNEISLKGHRCIIINIRTYKIFENSFKDKIQAVCESVYGYAKEYNELRKL